MDVRLPPPGEVLRAVETYLQLAYDRGPPAPVADRVRQVRAATGLGLHDCPAFERTGDRLALRLGNRRYPHMKLVVEGSTTGLPHFRVDTHDRHFLELAGAEDPRLAELITWNAELARAIEDAWSVAGLPTPREHWRERLAGWRATRP